MRVAPGRDVRLNPPTLERLDVGLTEVAIVQCCRVRLANRHRDGVYRGLRFSLVVGMIRERLAHYQEVLLRDGNLDVVVLVKALVGAVLHDARVGVGEVVLVLVAGARGRRCRPATSRLTTAFAGFLLPLPHLRFVLRLLRRFALLGPGVNDRLGFRQTRQSRFAQRNLVADHQAIGQVAPVGPLAQGQQLRDLGLQLRPDLQQALVAHGVAFRGVRVDLAAVEAERPQLQHSHHSGQQQDLHEEPVEVWQEGLAKARQRVVVRVQVAGDEAERRRVVSRPLELARAEHTRRVTVEDEPDQHLGRVGLTATRAIPGIDGRQVELGDRVNNKTRQVIGRQTVAQPHCHVESRLVVYRLECSVHTHNLPQPGRFGLTFSPTGC